MAENNFFIPNTSWVDFFNPKAAECYWKNFSNNLLKPYGIDAWWQDATEPENDDLVGRKVINNTVPGEFYRNVYPLYVNKTVYQGSRKDAPDRRRLVRLPHRQENREGPRIHLRSGHAGGYPRLCEGRLTLHPRKGSFPGMLQTRNMKAVIIGGNGKALEKNIMYDGNKTVITL